MKRKKQACPIALRLPPDLIPLLPPASRQRGQGRNAFIVRAIRAAIETKQAA